MQKVIFIFSLLFIFTVSHADKYVNGYYKKDGSYVNGYTRSNSDSYRHNNYSSQSLGGNKRDEYSTVGSTNKKNSSYGMYDNDNDGIGNSFDRSPNKKSSW